MFKSNPKWPDIAAQSRDRARYILKMTTDYPVFDRELDDLGLGTARSMEAYQEFAGLNLSERTIRPRCMEVWDYNEDRWVRTRK